MVGPTLKISQQIHAEKYRQEGETFEQAMQRIASALSDNSPHQQSLNEIFLNQRFLPAGRIQTGAGTTRAVTLYNCFVSGDISDNFTDRGGIMARASEAAETMRRGGGVGYNFGSLRPRGAHINSLGSPASGPVSFMHIYDAVCKTVSSAGHRRGAQMGILPVHHPDILEFVKAKQNDHSLTAFNISVGITDDFMHHLYTNTPFPLNFNGKTYSLINPQELWNEIMQSTWDYAEPGVIFLDTINRMNNLWYCETISATNPCVVGNTLILTKKGYKEIASLVDQEIEIWNGQEFTKVKPFVSGYNKKILLIKTSDGKELECTENHEFILRDGNTRIKAKDLKIGEKLLKWDAPVLEPVDVYHSLAYQQGFYSGDGWEDKRGRQYIGLYGTKKELVDKFVYQTIHEYDVSGGYENTNTNETRIYLKVQNQLSKTFVPDASFWNIKSRLEWLAGLADSDGTVSRSNSNSINLQITSKDKIFLDNVSLMLSTLGVHTNVGTVNSHWRITITAFDLVKLQKLGFKTFRLDLSNNNPDRDAKRFITIVAVEDHNIIADKVYCFTEEKNHSGVFNGILTGQCSEQPLPPNGACLLGSFNLVKYVRKYEDGLGFDWPQYHSDIRDVVRAMDNVVDISLYPLLSQKDEALSKRRMGLGITGFANASEILGWTYGSEESLKFLNAVLDCLKYISYNTSVYLAREKGSFPLLDKEKYLKGKFVETLPSDLKEAIQKYGIRNSHLTSIAPTGTISIAADNVSSGIEPVFSLGYARKIRTIAGEITEYFSDYAFREFKVRGKTADKLTASEHLNVLLIAQNHVDSAVSKTCNVNPKMPWDDFKNLYLHAYQGGAKGLSTFNSGGKRMGILESKEVVDDEQEGLACFIDPKTGERSCG